MGLGFVVAGLAASRFLKEIGKPVDWAYEMVFAALVGGIVGARLWWVAENWSDAKDDLLGSLFSGSGLVWYGGAIGGADRRAPVGLAAQLPRRCRCSTWRPCRSPIGYAIGRIGCQLAGDGDYGIAVGRAVGDGLSERDGADHRGGPPDAGLRDDRDGPRRAAAVALAPPLAARARCSGSTSSSPAPSASSSSSCAATTTCCSGLTQPQLLSVVMMAGGGVWIWRVNRARGAHGARRRAARR